MEPIEELTRQVLNRGLLMVVVFAPPLALALGLLLLTLYRRAVIGSMARSARPAVGHDSAAASAAFAGASPGSISVAGTVDPDLLASLLRGRRRAIARVFIAGMAYAATIALALVVAMEEMRSALGFALGAWGALWPVIPALWLAVPGGGRAAAIAMAAYLLPLAVIVVVGLVGPGIASDSPEALAAAIRSGWSPPELIRFWLVFNGVPTALLLLVLNRWTRAVGPLVLTFSTLLVAGFTVALFALASTRGLHAIEQLAQVTRLSDVAVLAALALLVLAAGVAAAWTVLRRVGTSYAAKRANDRSLTLDSLWLLFAVFHGAFFALVDVAWFAAGGLAFVVCRLALGRVSLTSPTARQAGSPGLVFLRVFSLGRRTEKLFDGFSRYWRHCGSVQLITGPDLARSTVQPHQMLDFVSGQLSRHFVADAASLRNQIAALDRAPDRDGLYRINSLFCHADTWQAALAALVAQGDRVLMDLRSFGASNAGCTTEIQHLVHHVPLTRCLFVIDTATDRDFLARTLRDAWATMPADSPNAGSSADSAPLYPIAGRWHDVGPLLHRLAATA